LFGSESELLQEQINEANSDDDRLRILGAFLYHKAQKRNSALDVIDIVVQKVLSKKGAISVLDLAGFAGYSTRQLERGFRSRTGFNPKYFSRIVRFQQAMKSYDTREVKNLSELAYHSGYADQAHFIREFQEFSGMKPRLYFKELKEVASSFVQI
ncbi:MAG: helix-turn-helix transcriptional regulator, partial [Bacteroidota bacterium]